MMLRWVTTTPAGERVEPEVYCSSAVVLTAFCGGGTAAPAKSRVSTSTIRGSPLGTDLAQATTASTAAEVVSTVTGAASASAPVTRSSCTPNIGTDSGTAISPAVIAPRDRKSTRLNSSHVATSYA